MLYVYRWKMQKKQQIFSRIRAPYHFQKKVYFANKKRGEGNFQNAKKWTKMNQNEPKSPKMAKND